MSLRNRIFLPVILSAFGALIGCGGNGVSITHPTPPPSGGFSPSNLNGTYVFSVSGTDLNGFAYAIVGTFAANGSQGITSGVLDMNDSGFSSSSISPIANAAISSGSYSLGVDGRGQIKLNTGNNTPFTSPIVLDFVLQDSTHGLVTEFDGNASGSGSLDLQSSGVTPTGSYAFIFSGAYGTSGSGLATVGNFTLNASAMNGLEDFNSSGIAVTTENLSGTFALGPSSTPATQITATGSSNYAITYDVFAVDATHLKFIEMDANGTLSGDAFAQTSTTMPTGTLAFTLIGAIGTATSFTATSAGGFLVTDGNGNITSASSEDFINSSGTATTSPIGFTGQYAGAGGRYSIGPLSGFEGASAFAAYPSSGGVLLLEVDNSGMMAGAAYPQSSTAVPDPSQGYGLNLSGTNLGAATGSLAEVDDIAEFATASSGLTFTGIIDENSAPNSQGQTYALALSSGSYTAPSGGRGQLGATAGNSTSSTLNGGFSVDYYTVDGTTFPFIENDGGQIAAGVFVKQNSSASSSAATRAHMYVLPSVLRPRTVRKQK